MLSNSNFFRKIQQRQQIKKHTVYYSLPEHIEIAAINEHPTVPECTLTELEGDAEDIRTDIDTGNEIVKEPCKHVVGIMYSIFNSVE